MVPLLGHRRGGYQHALGNRDPSARVALFVRRDTSMKFEIDLTDMRAVIQRRDFPPAVCVPP